MHILAELRKKKKLTQTDVASYVCVDRSTVAKWETGNAFPRIETLRKLAELYGCPMENLLQSKSPPT